MALRPDKNSSQSKMESLEFLVEEMLKEHPEEAFVKSAMKEIGLTYSDDPIERLNVVLQALHRPRVDGKSDDKNYEQSPH